MTAPPPRFEEPLRRTLTRTISIAIVAGTAVSFATRGRLFWPIAVLVMLWPSLGGHYVEVWFLERLRPQLPPARGVQLLARLGTWFAAGAFFAWAMAVTARELTGGLAMRALPWWVGGLGFVGVELIAHLGLLLLGRPSVYDGQG